MKLSVFFVFFEMLMLMVSAQQLPSIGNWREHVPFNNSFQVENQQELIVCGTPYGFFTYNPVSKEFKRKTKMNDDIEISFRKHLLKCGRISSSIINLFAHAKNVCSKFINCLI